LRGSGLALAGTAGACLAVQSRINGELGTRLHDGLLAAATSFGTGLVLLFALVLPRRAGRQGLAAVRAALRSGTLRPWHCLGGMGGAYLVVTQGLTVAVLGVAVYTVAVVAGQTSSSLAVDRAGLGPAGPQALTWRRVAGAVIAVIAVAVAVADRFGSARVVGLALLPALAGVGVAWQQAANGQVHAAAGGRGAFPAALVNFFVGTVALLFAAAVDLAVRGWPSRVPGQAWLYAGGAAGVAYVALSTSAVRRTGVLLLALGMIAGQLAGALAIDVAAPAGAGPSPNTLAGAALTLLAIAVAVLPGSRAAPGPPGSAAARTWPRSRKSRERTGA
jgi:transporter family-2 protein